MKNSRMMICAAILTSTFLLIACGGGGGSSSDDNFTLSTTSVLENNVDGYWTHAVRYNDPGLDDTWHTSDDVIDYYTDVLRNPDNTRILWSKFIGFGSNGIWIDGDDVLGEYCLYDYDVYGNMMKGYVYDDPGLDATWFSGDDDVMSEYFVCSRDVNYRSIRQVRYNPDDSVKYYYLYYYDNDGRQIRGEVYDDPGVGAMWFDSNDIITAYYTYEFDLNGRRLRRYWYYDPGSDEIWINGDDPVALYYQLSRDSNNYIIREDKYIPYTPPGSDSLSVMSLSKAFHEDPYHGGHGGQAGN